MSRVHDMGGRFGDGPVRPEPTDAPRFAAAWHRRAMAMTIAAGALGAWSIDAARYARESLPPRDYNRFSYYEKWIAALADLLAARGLVSPEELAGAPVEPAPISAKTLRAEAVAPLLAAGAPSARPGPAPAFAPGAVVRCRLPARNLLVPGGHTRLPGYAAGHIGRIVDFHGCHVFPDSNAHYLGEAPQPLYTVAFDAGDLWGTAERAGDLVMADLWESYLEPVA